MIYRFVIVMSSNCLFACFRFLQVCSLSDLLQHMSDTDSSHGTSGSSEPTLIDLDSSSDSCLQTGDKTASQPDFVKLVIEGNVHRFENACKYIFNILF